MVDLGSDGAAQAAPVARESHGFTLFACGLPHMERFVASQTQLPVTVRRQTKRLAWNNSELAEAPDEGPAYDGFASFADIADRALRRPLWDQMLTQAAQNLCLSPVVQLM